LSLALPATLLAILCSESAFLGGFSFGGTALVAPEQELHLRLAIGVDWLHESGFAILTRAEVDERIVSAAALSAGWWGSGLLGGEGFPLGFSAGAAGRLDLDGRAALGPRAASVLSLWYARATVELDATWWQPLSRSRDAEITVGLSLRLVPWEPWRTGGRRE
jgi:hypothetical protein